MAQAAIAAIAKVLVSYGVKAAIAKFAATVFVYAASSYLLNRAAKSMTPKSKTGAGVLGQEVNYFDTGASARIVYGRVKTGGMETIPPVIHGAHNEFAHKVLTLAGHEINSFEATLFDATTISGVANNNLGPQAWTGSDGMVLGGPYSGHAFVRYYRGTSTDSADRVLMEASSAVFNKFRGIGIAKAMVAYKWNDEVYKGLPDPTFVYQGKRCYDPALDSSPGADPTNPAFATFTSCPARCLADFLMADYGGGYQAGDIDWNTVVTAATACDALVSINGAVGTQPRYTCNGVLLAAGEKQFEANVKALVNSMLGRLIFTDGKWKMFAGGWKTPSFSIAKNDWISGLSIKTEQGKRKRFNRMRCWFVDPTRNWTRASCYPRSNATYLTADKGERIDAEFEDLMCNDEQEAQRKAEFLLRASRNQIIVAGRLPPRFQDVALWDTGSIVMPEFGWSSKTFRAVALDMNPDGTVDGVFAEEQSSDWTDLLVAEYGQPSAATVPSANATLPSAPRNFQAVPQVNGTILFTWDVPAVNPAGTRFQIIRSTTSLNNFAATYEVGNGRTIAMVMPVSRHWYFIRGVTQNATTALGPVEPTTYGVAANARLEADQTLQQRMCGDAEFDYSEAASLWQFGTLSLAAAADVNVASLGAAAAGTVAYVASGGQFGGYANMRWTNVASFNNSPVMLSYNHANSLGQPIGGGPQGVEYNVRFRVNSMPNNGVGFFEMFMLRTFSTANSANILTVSARALVTSAMMTAGIGQWNTIKLNAVLMPAAVSTGVGGAATYMPLDSRENYARAGIFLYATNSGFPTNLDVDYFQATLLGHVNHPLKGETVSGAELSEWKSMVTEVFNSNSSNGSVTFPDWQNGPYGRWQDFAIGRRFTVLKTGAGATAAVFINPSSGMTLKLAGRASVGTVTMVTSLSARATIEKVDNAELLVDGVGLI